MADFEFIKNIIKKYGSVVVILVILFFALKFSNLETSNYLPKVSTNTKDQILFSPEHPIGEMLQYPVLFTSNGDIEANIIYKEPSLYGDIVVFDFGSVRCFLLDGANESCWNFESGNASEYVSDIVFFLQNSKSDIKDVLVIGAGAGTLLKQLDGTDYIIDAVEINPSMFDVAEKYFELPKNLNYNIIIDDGRHYLNSTDKKYDAIILDICNVNNSNAHLWTKEFYALAFKSLKNPKEGIVIASRGAVSSSEVQKLDNMIANAIKESFTNLYFTSREENISDEYDVVVYLATNKELSNFPERWPQARAWEFNASYDSSSDANLDKTVKLFLPATAKIIEQTKINFGTDIFFK